MRHLSVTFQEAAPITLSLWADFPWHKLFATFVQ
jgi:hypothetical protein